MNLLLRIVAAIVLPFCLYFTASACPKLDGPGINLESCSVPAHSLVKAQMQGVDAKTATLWDVVPSTGVTKATTTDDRLEFAAPPGDYEVQLTVIAPPDKDGKLKAVKYTAKVKVLPPPGPPTPPQVVPPVAPPAPDSNSGTLNPPAALAKMSFPPYGCTATVMGPRRADGKWDVLSAAHCVSHVTVGSRGTIKLLDGRSFAITVQVVDPKCDVSWLTTDDAGVANMPYAVLAKENPPVGTKIWHAGYGVDIPGNREDGIISGDQNGDGMLNMTLSVSSGDSGGGIFRADTNEVVSSVCCTTAKGRRASVWGVSTVFAAQRRPKAVQAFEWNPKEIPILETLR